MKIAAVILSIIAVSSAANAQEWTFGPPLQVARGWAGACVAPCGDVYIVSGNTGPGQRTETVEILRYDRAGGYADAWEMGPPVNTARNFHAVVCVGGYVYAIGGGDGNGPLSSVERLDVLADQPTWVAGVVPDLPIPLGTANAVADGAGRIWVIGPSQENVGSVFVFDPCRPEHGWVSGPPFGERGSCCPIGAAADRWGRIYALGGGDSDGNHLAAVDRLDPCHEPWMWEPVTAMLGSSSNTNLGTLGFDGRIFVAGGWLPGFSNRSLRYDPGTDEWEAWGSLNARKNAVAMVTDAEGSVLAIGGETETPGNFVDSVEILTRPCGVGTEVLALRDCDGDGDIDFEDLLCLLTSWGPCGED